MAPLQVCYIPGYHPNFIRSPISSMPITQPEQATTLHAMYPMSQLTPQDSLPAAESYGNWDATPAFYASSTLER